MNDRNVRRSKRLLLSTLLLSAALCAAAAPAWGQRGKGARTIEGTVYFTNDSPDVYEFPVELFDSKFRRVAAKRTERDGGYFEFRGLRPGKYYLQVLVSARCLLQYEVDARRGQPEALTILGDAGCGHHQIPGMPAPRPVPRDKKR